MKDQKCTKKFELASTVLTAGALFFLGLLYFSNTSKEKDFRNHVENVTLKIQNEIQLTEVPLEKTIKFNATTGLLTKAYLDIIFKNTLEENSFIKEIKWLKKEKLPTFNLQYKLSRFSKSNQEEAAGLSIVEESKNQWIFHRDIPINQRNRFLGVVRITYNLNDLIGQFSAGKLGFHLIRNEGPQLNDLGSRYSQNTQIKIADSQLNIKWYLNEAIPFSMQELISYSIASLFFTSILFIAGFMTMSRWQEMEMELNFANKLNLFKRKTKGKGKRTALVVDDDENVREILVDYLQNIGLEVTQASDGSEALDLVSKTDYDFVFTDLEMPKMKGDVFIDKAKEQKANDTKYIVVSGMVPEAEKDHKPNPEFEKIHADRIIAKPFTEDLLKNIVIDKNTPMS